MAGLDGTITIKADLRPCFIDSLLYKEPFRALFHTWGCAGAENRTFAFVETMDGRIVKVKPQDVHFLDTACKVQEVEGAFMLADERDQIKREVKE